MVDTGVYVVARHLIDALTIQLAGTRAGAPCVATVQTGTSVPSDTPCQCIDDDGAVVGEGQAWTRVASLAMTTAFPTPLSRPVPRGQIPQLMAVIELGVERCYALTDDNSPSGESVIDSAARDALDDAAAMLAAIRNTELGEDIVIGSWTPRAVLGGVHGGTMTVTVCVDTCAPGSSMPPLDEVIPMLDGDPRA